MEELPAGPHLKKGYFQFGYFGMYVGGRKVMRKGRNSRSLETGEILCIGGIWKRAALGAQLGEGDNVKTTHVTNRVFLTASLFR